MATLPAFHTYAENIMKLRYSHTVQGRKENWLQIASRVCEHVLGAAMAIGVTLPLDIAEALFLAIAERKFIPGGRILSQAGRPYHQTDNCFCLRAEDTREGWADLAHKTTMMFMSGGGVGVDYSDLRPYGTPLHRSGGVASGPIPCIQMVNSIGAAARQGGERRGAIYASLVWNHQDIIDFISLKSSSPLEHTNISTRFDMDWLNLPAVNCARNLGYICQEKVFLSTLHHACKYGDPGFQFDWDNQILRNACTEIITEDDCDSCCLGSINIAKIKDLKELAYITQLGVLFLLCNTLYTDIPYAKVRTIKEKNRRIGLGLMGVGEWFIQRGQQYGETGNSWKDCISYPSGTSGNWYGENYIENWLATWKSNSILAAQAWSNKLSIAYPVALRAIAPTGTISIAGGHTTPGIEPVFHTAYLRTYNTLKEQVSHRGLTQEKVIDTVVAHLYEQGYNVDMIDTAYTLSQSIEGIERRLQFQAFCQRFVDNGISTTINLPAYTEGIEDTIAPVLLKYLPQLRGVTFYPDGAYGNQPVQPINFSEAVNSIDTQIVESESCKGGVCGV